MFKNAIIYRLGKVPEGDLEAELQSKQFVPCGPTQPVSCGWIPPRGAAGGALIEMIGGQYILKLQTETKVLPGDAVKRKLAERCKLIEEQTGRKPGKKQVKELKEEVYLELLPSALTRRATTLVWIDWAARLVIVDTTSAARADDIVSLLVSSLEGMKLIFASTGRSPNAAMSEWLLDTDAPRNFTIDRECELKALDETNAVVRYGNHALDIDEVKQHIEHGKCPTRLAMTWMGRVSFQLTDTLALRKIKLLDVTMEGNKDTAVDAFDGNVAIATGELRQLIADLAEELDGFQDIFTPKE